MCAVVGGIFDHLREWMQTFSCWVLKGKALGTGCIWLGALAYFWF